MLLALMQLLHSLSLVTGVYNKLSCLTVSASYFVTGEIADPEFIIISIVFPANSPVRIAALHCTADTVTTLSSLGPTSIACCSQTAIFNQACTSHRPTRTWFLKIDSVRMSVCVHVCVCVCVSAPKAINN